jgi:capsular exopolysaccharide synthesis family protein
MSSTCSESGKKREVPGRRAIGARASRLSPRQDPHDSTGESVHLLDRLNVVYRYRYVALSVVALVVLGSLLRTYTTTPLYRAQARLLIEIEDERTTTMAGTINAGNNESVQNPEPYYNTQYRILVGRELGRRVVQRLDLASVPEFNGRGPTPTALSRLIGRMREEMTVSARALLGGRRLAMAPGAETMDEGQLANAFLSRISIEPVQNSRLVDVSFVSADPQFAVRAVNVHAEEYVAQNLELRRQNMAKSLEWLTQELVKQEQKVKEGERALAQYREDHNALSLEDRQNIVVARLNQLNDAVTQAKRNRVHKETQFSQIKGLELSVSPDTTPVILQNAYIQSIKARVADLQRERAGLLERYGEKYPAVMDVNANILDAQRQLSLELAKAIDAVRNDYQSALTEERTLSRALEEQKSTAMDLSRKNVGYTVLEREAQSNRQVYEALLQREKELQVLANSQGNNVRLMDRAETPTVPFTPRPQRDLMLAVVAGLILAVGLVLAVDSLDDTIKTPEDVTRTLKLPFLGLVPLITGENSTRPLLVNQEVSSGFGEAFRAFRTNVRLSMLPDGMRSVVVTSACAGDGKTLVASNLAVALALSEHRVLLIDADLRRPSLHTTFNLSSEPGLTNFLTGEGRTANLIRRTRIPRLHILTAGPLPPNPSELLDSHRFRKFLMQLGKHYDWVILDSPPVMPVTDAIVLAEVATGVIFVTAADETPIPASRSAINQLKRAPAPILGVVLNRADLKRRGYYTKYYKRGAYQAQYEHAPA